MLEGLASLTQTIQH